VPGKNSAPTIGSSSAYDNNDWTAEETTTVAWPMLGSSVAYQSSDFVASQDLCFSNNISKYTINASTTDNRIAYNTTTRKFTTDKTTAGNNPERGGKMIFYHALTKITFQLKKGDGFDSSDPFKFTQEDGEKNIELVGFNTTGTFNIVDGEFTSTGNTTAINKLNIREDNRTGDASGSYGIADGKTYAYVLDGLLVPGSDLNSDLTTEINFHIDHNTYHIKKSQLLAALKVNDELQTLSDGSTPVLDGSKMRAGVHYIFNLEVNKKAVAAITAAVVPWEEVNATEGIPTNAKIEIDLLDDQTKRLTGDPAAFDLFRIAHVHSDIVHDHADYSWDESGYAADKATLTGANPYTATGWYWPNNKTFYHFRVVKPKTDSSWGVVSRAANDGGDYITLTGEKSYKDVCWGAPFTGTGERLQYSSDTGFDKKTGTAPDYTSSQIYKAIGPTDGIIHMVLFHMMSDVTIKLTTPRSGETDYDARVDLAGASIKLTNIYDNGEVRMGDGKVTPTNPRADPLSGTVDSQYEWTYGFVPQDLTDVVLTITTTDGNQYEVAMKDVEATVANIESKLLANPYKETAAGSTKYKINRWYPNYKYTYTFKLKKKGIEKITATVADWETVTAAPEEVQIK
jgi:hypothetical protein